MGWKHLQSASSLLYLNGLAINRVPTEKEGLWGKGVDSTCKKFSKCTQGAFHGLLTNIAKKNNTLVVR
jgi:hypothetical protein